MLLATAPPYVTIAGKNYLLICFSFFGMIALTIINYTSFPPLKEPWLWLIFLYMTFSSIVNYEEAQALSFWYSLYFIFSYLFYVSLMLQRFTRSDYRKLLLFVFLLYFCGLIVGQFYVYLGFFRSLTGIGNVDSLHGLWGTVLQPEGFRFYSLSSEPSYAAFIVITLFYSYLITDPKGNSLFKGESAVLFLLVIYMLLMFKSAYGIVLIGALIIWQYGFTKTSILIYSLAPLMLFFLSLFGYNFQVVERLAKIAQELDWSNLHSLAYIDFPSYFRIAPFLYYFESSSLLEASFYLGHGASASKHFIVPEIYLAYENGEFTGGILPAFLYDYGLIGMILLVGFIYKRIGFISIPSLIIVLMMLNANFNTQLFWFLIICFSMNQHFIEQSKGEVVVVKPLA